MLESRDTWTGNRLQKNFSHISLKSLLAKLGDSSVLSLVTFNLSQSLLSPLSHLCYLWMSNPAGSFAAPLFTMGNRLGLPIHKRGLEILSHQDISCHQRMRWYFRGLALLKTVVICVSFSPEIPLQHLQYALPAHVGDCWGRSSRVDYSLQQFSITWDLPIL